MPFPSIKDNRFIRAAKQFPAASAGVAANVSQKASVLSYTDVTGELPDAQMPVNHTFREFVGFAPAASITTANLNEMVPDARLGDTVNVFLKSAAGDAYWSGYQRWVATAANAAGVITAWTRMV